MITPKGIAAAVVGLASLSLVGVALANEAEGPELADEVEVVTSTCDDTTTTVEDDTVDDGTLEEGSPDDGALEAPAEEGAELADDDCDEVDADDDADDDADEGAEVEAAEVQDEGVAGERPMNHGFYVSEATKTCPESGRERGECISAVAQSDLGKSHAEELGDEGVVEDEAGQEDLEGSVEEAPTKPAKQDAAGQARSGGGKGKGKR